MCNLYKGPSIDASYQVSVHLAKGFQRRRLKCEKLPDARRRTPSDSKSSHCLWQGELITKFSHRLVLSGSRNLSVLSFGVILLFVTGVTYIPTWQTRKMVN
jgi:hypothetical protein